MPYEPEKCWVNEKAKVCYPDEDTAEMTARLLEAEHQLPKNFLHAYHCQYGNHWHLAGSKPKSRNQSPKASSERSAFLIISRMVMPTKSLARFWAAILCK